MRTRMIWAAVLFVAAGWMTAGCSRQKNVEVMGSDTMVNLGQAWAEAFMKQNPKASVSVTGGGSGTGITALINGTTDIAECSRAMKDKEIADAKAKGVQPKETVVAFDGIAVVVNKANPVSELTIAQLGDIFTGKVRNWKEVGGPDKGIVLLSRENNSGTHVYFKEHVLRRGNEKGPEEYAEKTQFLPSSQNIVDQVLSGDAAIGYVGLGYVSDKLKVIAVAKDEKGPYVPASVGAVLDHSYAISRPLYMYTNGEPKGNAKAFLDFALSDAGQKIVEELGFVPLPKK